MHSSDGVQPIVGSEARPECVAHQCLRGVKLGSAEFARLGDQNIDHDSRVPQQRRCYVVPHRMVVGFVLEPHRHRGLHIREATVSVDDSAQE